ncbi:MAG: VanW family protein [Candidatus Doudnabacteria bacterium]|jgi:vancomycin resistance protein YoaR
MKSKFIFFLFVSCGLATLPSSTILRAQAPETFSLTYKTEKFVVDKNALIAWQGKQILTPSPALAPAINLEAGLLAMVGQPPKKMPTKTVYNYRLAPAYEFILEAAKKINVDSVNPVLKIENNLAVKFTPPQTGIKINAYKTALETLNALQSGKSDLEMSAYESEPQVSLSSTNDLGINELVAQGVSNFKGSPNNRRHNITVGVEKFKGLIIKRGEEFSFNKFLGEVDGEHGFLPELVIKKEGTVPEFGGGLCQVSSTAFRAAMNGGLPITQRRNHAYAVQYYAPQGTDATIYPGVVDLKFINDTPGAILIWAYEKDKNTLVFDFYGSKDSRQVSLEKPVQYDRKPDGSMKATWTRTVIKDGAEKTDVFKSTYQSPALFHKTEEFAKTPTTTPVVIPQ